MLAANSFAIDFFSTETVGVSFSVCGNNSYTQGDANIACGIDGGLKTGVGLIAGLSVNGFISSYRISIAETDKAFSSVGIGFNVGPCVGYNLKTDFFLLQLMAYPVLFEENFFSDNKEDSDTLNTASQKLKTGVRASFEFSDDGTSYKGFYVSANYIWSYGYMHSFEMKSGVDIGIGVKISEF